MNYTLKVVEIRKETEDTVTLCFKQPGLKKIKYIAGQYLTLIFRINNRRYIRPYSFSSCPDIDEFLEVTVKRVTNGIVSNHIIDTICVGDTIEAMPPMGTFLYNNTEKYVTDVYLWGVGSGITPLFSIAKHILFFDTSTVVHLIYGNRNHQTTIFLNKILELENIYKSRFIVKHFHTKLAIDQYNPSRIQGRIDKEKARSILEDNKKLINSAHYICGPVGLKESVKDAISLFKVNENNVYIEDFELVKNPADYDHLYTRTIKLNFNGVEFALEISKGKTILEAALDANIELPYSCQTGSCDTCMGRLINGEATMIGLNKKRDDLMDSQYLLCCTHPLNDKVYIEI